MVFSSGLSWTIWIIAICGFVASEDDIFIERPLITPNKWSVTLDSGSYYSLNCVSEFPITWKPSAGFPGIYQVSHEEMPENELRYGSTIHLINVTHYYVGAFWCVVNSTQLARDYYSIDFLETVAGRSLNGTAGIYVFVNDPVNLLVPHSDYLIKKEVGAQYLVITCKPTCADTNLRLLEDGHEMDMARYQREDSVGLFVRFSAVAEIYGKRFTCMPESPNHSNETEQQEFFITYHVPTVQSATGLYGRQGEQLTLTCSIDLLKDEQFTIEWMLPHGNISFTENRVDVSAQTVTAHPTRPDLKIVHSKIVVKDVAVGKDDGNYTCEVTDGLLNRVTNQIFIDILNRDDNSIDIYALSGNYRMEKRLFSREVAVWEVKYKGNPRPTLSWYSNNDRKIPLRKKYGKYEVKITGDFTTLTINDLELKDSGYYTLKASNYLQSTEKRFELQVMSAPSVYMGMIGRYNTWVKPGSSSKLICKAEGYPLSKIKWTMLTPCNSTTELLRQPDCETRLRKTIEEKYIHTTSTSVTTQTSVLNYIATETGMVQCIAINAQGQHKASTFFRVEDMDEPFQIWGVDLNTRIFTDDNVTATCGASNFIFASVEWRINSRIVGSTDDDDVTVERADTKYSYRQVITWTNIKTTHSGIYECSVIGRTQRDTQSKTLNITVHEAKKPEIMDPMETFTMPVGEPIRLTCNFSGLPPPSIEWQKNGKLIEDGNGFVFSADMQTLEMAKLTMEDDGEFKCIVNNSVGSAEKSITLKITDLPNVSNATAALPTIGAATGLSSMSFAWIVAFAVLILVLIFCTVYLLARFRGIRRELESFLNFDGKPECISSNLAVHEQADLLPYDKKYEFPKEQLELGERLGAGAFGVVVQASATGILPHEEKTTVAVKMLKRSADNEQVRALTIELKIMVHLGHHLNVVNLLGAVTKNIAKRELMVIVEYCRFGNVQTFLLKHRKSFVNQVDPESDAIDGTVLTKEQRRTHDSSEVDPREGPDASFAETSFITSTPGPITPCESHIGDDNNDPMRNVTTSDLVCWSFQVARGMEYLASRKVLHGDLAARNILLCDDNVVKICDFGLARSLYECPDYTKDKAAKVPMKWLAIESICDGLFSSMSDVWSFGICMWELFSLGETPYPGMEMNENFCLKLKNGYRMTKPKNATRSIYDIMLHCWDANPASRPSFGVLEERLKKLLPIAVASHYIDLNEKYVKMYARRDQTMQPTEEEVVPVGVGGNNPSMEPSTYLPMKPLFGNDVSETRGDANDAVSKPDVVECL